MASSDYQRKQRQAELEAQENLNSAQEDELAGLQAINRERERELEHTKDLAKSLQKNLGLLEEQGDALRGIINVFTPLNERAASLFSTMNQLKNPLTAGFELIKLSAQRFAELDNAAMSFRQNTGFLASQTKQIETNIRVASRDLAGFGVTVEVASESAQQLANAFGDTAIANRENIEYVSLMKQNLGVSAEDSTALMQNFMGIGGMSSKVARETAGAAASMAKAAGVPYGAVMKEVAKPSAEVRSLIRGSVDALIKGAIEAKRLGTSLEAVGKAAAGMLDFQTSINDEMEASVLFGKDVNLQKARELAYAGDLENLAKEQSRLLQEAGDVSKMDYFQRMGIAKALGMSVEEMDKMNAKQQELNQLRLEDPETYEKLTAKQKVMDKTKESLSDKYKKELLSQQLASQQEKITASINQIMVELSEILLPILNGLMPIVSILLKISGIMVTLVLAPFKEFYNLVSKIWDYFAPGVDLFKLIADQLDRFSSFLKSDDIGRWGAGLAGLVILAVATFGSTTWTTVLVNAITWPFKLAFMGINKLMGNKIKDVVKTATDAAKSAASSASSAVQNVTSNVGGKGVAPAAAGPTSGGAGGGNKFMDTVKGIKPAQLLSLGVAMLAFAGAMYILAKAGQEFNSVDWSSLGKMATAAVVMGVTLGVLAAVMAPLQPILWPLVGVMLAFGAAMLAVGYSTKLFGEGFALMNNLDLLKIGMGLYTLSGAVLAFGASMAGGGMLSFLGGGMMLQLVALAAISPALNNASMALSSIGGTLQMFKDEAIVEGIENITEAIKGLNKEINNVNLLNVAGLALLGNTAKGAAGGGGDEVVNKLDELIGLMKSGAIAVNIDGTKVSTAVGVATKFRGQ
jgi:hypothetical protein